jgi:NADH-quinone oxidoreductase subunit E
LIICPTFLQDFYSPQHNLYAFFMARTLSLSGRNHSIRPRQAPADDAWKKDISPMDIEPNVLADFLEQHKDGGSIISVLEEIQARYHYLPQDAMILVSEKTGVPLSQLYSVATFYHAFSLTPRGEHTIHVCTGTACHVRGSVQILNRLEQKLGVRPGETTHDRQFTLETVNCLGCCALGPVVVVDDDYLGQMTAKKVDRMLTRAIRQGEKAR